MELRTINIDSIIVTDDNPRKINETSASFKALVETVKKVGVAIPIHVEESDKGYILKAGERRIKASKVCGLKSINAVVYKAGTAAGVMHLENFQRKDLTLIEQILSIDKLLAENSDPAWLANQLAVSDKIVKQLINIVSNLAKSWQKLLKEPGGWDKWTLTMIALIAKQSVEVQNELAERYDDWTREDETLTNLSKLILRYQSLLSTFCFDVKTECKDCKDRTDVQGDLFPEADINKAKCLNLNCSVKKYNEHIAKAAEKLFKTHDKLVSVLPKNVYSFAYTLPKGFVKPYTIGFTCDKVKKTDKGAIPGLMLLGKTAGTLIWVKVSQAASKRSEKNAAAKKPASQKTYKEKMAELTTKRHCGTHTRILEKMSGMTFAESKLDTPRLLILVSLIGGIPNFNYGSFIKLCAKVHTKNFGNLDELYAFIWTMVQFRLITELKYDGPFIHYKSSSTKEIKAMCEMLHIDYDYYYDEISKEKGFTIPKSWTKE